MLSCQQHGFAGIAIGAGILVALCCSFCAAAAAGSRKSTVFYVSPDGSGRWSGTRPAPDRAKTDGPFATITQARDAVRRLKASGKLSGPVTVRIRGGVYYLAKPITFTPQDSGDPARPVTYTAYPGESPVLCGGRRITGFKPYQGKVLRAFLPGVKAGKWYFRSFFANGLRQVRARYPDADPRDPFRKGFLYVEPGQEGSATAFRYRPGTVKPSWAGAPAAEIHIFPAGDSCRAYKQITELRSVDEATHTVTLSGRECTVPLSPGNRFFVENVFEELDSPGEWYLDRQEGYLYYWPEQSLSPESDVIAPVLGRVFEFLGDPKSGKPVHDIKISGLTIRETDYSPDDGCVGYGMGSEGVVHMQAATRCAVRNCRFVNIGKYAVCLTGSAANTVAGCEVAYGAEGGIVLIDSGRNTVSDNRIHHLGAVYKHIGGVVLEGGGSEWNRISHNLIHDISRYGITLKNPGGHNTVEYNRLYTLSTETYDTGGIEVTQHDREYRSRSVIRNNIVRDVIGYSSDNGNPVFLSWGIYLDSFAGGYTVRNNLVIGNANGGIMVQGGKDNQIENNILAGSRYSQLFLANFDNNCTGNRIYRNIVYYSGPDSLLIHAGPLTPQAIDLNNNLYFHAGGGKLRIRMPGRVMESLAEWQTMGFDSQSVAADPLFADPQKGNYALRPESPAIKLGFKPFSTKTVGPNIKKP